MVSIRIGIFDSGVGGLTVVRAVRAAIPTADIHYLGDTARVPYGSKSSRTVERYSLACLRFLLARDVDLVLIACNTASANALDALERESPVPVIGAVKPGAESGAGASINKHIGVIATLSTVASGAYEEAIRSSAPNASITTLACPLLVPLAEEGWTTGDIATSVARRYLTELFTGDPKIDTLVLGCTHYPLLAPVLTSVARNVSGRDVAVVDSATAMATRAATLAETDIAHHSSGGRRELHCYVTDASRLDVLGPRFLGEPLSGCELVDL